MKVDIAIKETKDYAGELEGIDDIDSSEDEEWARIINEKFMSSEKKEITIILKGGSGSGNFGHEGRPGEVGGSSTEGGGVGSISAWDSDFNKDGAVYVYHGTTEKAIKSILSKGLKVGKPWMDRNPSVYFTVDKAEASRWSHIAESRRSVSNASNKHIVIEFSIPDELDNDVIQDVIANRDMGWKSAFRIEKNIPKEFITKIIVGTTKYVVDDSILGYRTELVDHEYTPEQARKLLESGGEEFKDVNFKTCYTVIRIDDNKEEKQIVIRLKGGSEDDEDVEVNRG